MAPSRVRSRLRRLASRVLRSGSPEPRPSAPTQPTAASGERELTGLPPLQPGRGETPGPNHKSDISQEWASAQLHSGVPPLFIDLRPTVEFSAGHIPGALSNPQASLDELEAKLPPKSERIAVYDIDGEQGSEAFAATLRERGWAGTRRLVGGFEAWRASGDIIEEEPEA
jgi:rhodanese-related sulfurtransferase